MLREETVSHSGTVHGDLVWLIEGRVDTSRGSSYLLGSFSAPRNHVMSYYVCKIPKKSTWKLMLLLLLTKNKTKKSLLAKQRRLQKYRTGRDAITNRRDRTSTSQVLVLWVLPCAKAACTTATTGPHWVHTCYYRCHTRYVPQQQPQPSFINKSPQLQLTSEARSIDAPIPQTVVLFGEYSSQLLTAWMGPTPASCSTSSSWREQVQPPSKTPPSSSFSSSSYTLSNSASLSLFLPLSDWSNKSHTSVYQYGPRLHTYIDPEKEHEATRETR